jgi:hypothetical protein
MSLTLLLVYLPPAAGEGIPNTSVYTFFPFIASLILGYLLKSVRIIAFKA